VACVAPFSTVLAPLVLRSYEAFLGPELFFNPEVFQDARAAKPLSQIVDESIMSAAMDAKRDLYRNIVLSGGSTLFKNFHRRLKDDINKRVQERYNVMLARHSGRLTGTVTATGAGTGRIEVDVIRHDMQRYAVWFGGSVVSEMPGFHQLCHTRAQYMEEGPRIARHNAVFKATL
jgi:actin-related protein 3